MTIHDSSLLALGWCLLVAQPDQIEAWILFTLEPGFVILSCMTAARLEAIT